MLNPSFETPAAGAGWLRWLRYALLALLIGVSVGAAALEYTRTLRSDSVGGDQGLFAEMALIQLHGGTLYRDLWDNKPPMVFFMLGPFIELFGNNARAIKAEVVFVALVFTAVMAGLAYQLTGSKSAALAAGVIAFLYAARVNRTETGLHMATFGALAALIAVWGRGRLGWMLLAGLVFAAGVFSKQPLIVELPVLVALAVWRALSRRLRVAVAVLAGAALGAGIVFAWAAANDILPVFWQRVVTSNFQYVVGADGRWHFTDVAEELADESQLTQTIYFLLPLAGLTLISLALQWRAGRRSRLLAIVLVWLLLALAAASIGRGFKTNYYHQALPPLIALIALGVPYALRLRPALQAGLLALALAGALLFVATALEPFALPSESNLGETREIVALVANETPEDGCVWIWGYLNYVNFLSDRRSCNRTPYDSHTWKAYKYPVVANRSEYIHDLLGRQPALHVLRSDWPYFPQLQRYADRYLGDLLLDNGVYHAYEVDRSSWQPQRAAYNDEIALIGYDLWADTRRVCPGDVLPLALTWEQAARPAADYQMFARIVAHDGALLASYQGALDGERPTTTWDFAGEPFLGATFTLTMPTNAEAGEYRLETGLLDSSFSQQVGATLPLALLTVPDGC